MDIDIEVRYVGEDDIYAVASPTVPGTSLEVQSLEEVSYLAHPRDGAVAGTEVESMVVANVVEMDDGD